MGAIDGQERGDVIRTTSGGYESQYSKSHEKGLLVGTSAVRRDNDTGCGKGGEGTKSILWHVCTFILAVEMCERLAFYTFSSTLTLFFIKELNQSSHTAGQYTSLFSALVYFTPLLGGYVADELINRYRTIVIFVVLYIIGLGMVTAASYPSILSEPLILIGLLVFISLGAGGIKSNVVTLGGDQFSDNDPSQVRQRNQFFNYFYWAINFGALIANGYLNNLGFNPETFSGGTISYDMGYFTTYAIPLGVMVLALFIFLAGTSRYKVKSATDKSLSNFLRVFWRTLTRSGGNGFLVLLAVLLFVVAAIITVTSYFINNTDTAKWMNVVSLALIFLGSSIFTIICRTTTWLQSPPPDGNFSVDALALNNVHDMLLLFPYFGLLVVFWLCYIQMSTNFQVQGCQMYNLIGGIAFSPAFFTCFDTITILVLIPVVDNWFYPLIEKKRGSPLRALSKMWVGFVCMIAAMICAGVLEIFRKDASVAGPTGTVADCCGKCSYFSSNPEDNCVTACNGDQSLADTCQYNSACGGYRPITTFSIWWQIIPYAFVGLGEIFTSVSAYELFYNEVDESMRSVAQGINLLTTSFGSFAAGGLNGALVDWVPDNINESSARLDYFFFVIAAITALALIVFLLIYKSHVYRADRYDPVNGERFDGPNQKASADFDYDLFDAAECGSATRTRKTLSPQPRSSGSTYSHLSAMQSYASGASAAIL